MQQKKRITIIGAGAMGCFAAYMLQKQGYQVTLLEEEDCLMSGATQAANINHSDGFEYHKAGHQKTGEYCVDGAIVKALFHDSLPGFHQTQRRRHYDTEVCTPENPMRFLVSTDSLGKDGLTVESFSKNAEHMRSHFAKRFNYLSAHTKGGVQQIERILGRNPKNFARPLRPDEYADCANIACGYAGSGTGYNHQELLPDRIINSSPNGSINYQSSTHVDAIEKQESGRYVVRTNNGDFEADQVMLTAGHGVPELCEKIKNAEFTRKDGAKSADGTYYLNAMTYVDLPATRDKGLIKKLTHINFTLQGEGGAMFACIQPPTEHSRGCGAIYYPSEKGSQVARHVYDASHPVPPPNEWGELIKNGLANDSERVKSIMQQAYRYYPFLDHYAVPNRTICRTVFNAANKENNMGLDRRERDIVDADVITADGHVAAFRSPKWTNAELVGLIAVDQAMQALGDAPLPKNEEYGYGPTKIDVERLFPRRKMDKWAYGGGTATGRC